ncbi:MAG TPA: alpha/beta hydrolase [Acidimicrobiaceae bacterium]|nr:alpha/beta hydrolase [Acidimicrobiaceae bacterium]
MDCVIARRVRYGSLSVVEAGDRSAPALVLLHGIGSSGDAFLGQADLQMGGLADRWRLLAPDAPGYGASDDPPEAPGIDGFADGVARLIEDAGVAEAVLLGVSWGGVIATRFALRHADRLKALVLADTSRGSGFDSKQAGMMRQRARDYAADPAAFVRDRTPLLVADGCPVDVVEGVARIMEEACRMPGYGHAAESLAETDHAPHLSSIDVPTLVVVGEYDHVCPPSDSRLLVEGISGASYVEVPGTGHLPNQERPAEFNQIVGDWLDGLLP